MIFVSLLKKYHLQQKASINMSQITTNRRPIVAGQFYPSDATRLTQIIQEFSDHAIAGSNTDKTIAIISPHAGYPFSGKVAASSFKQINADKAYDNIFILASSHQTMFEGASIYSKGNYETPLGEIKVNQELANQLINNHSVFNYVPQAHSAEHSLEVQLPFLQYNRNQPTQIVPVVLGTKDPKDCKNIAEILKPYFNGNNLFVISTDFSHYPAYDDANNIDKVTARAIKMNDPEVLLETLESNKGMSIEGLRTSLCGWTSVLTLLYMSETLENVDIDLIDYQNSGDSEYGDKRNVVGYQSIAFRLKNPGKIKESEEQKKEGFTLQNDEKKALLTLSRNTLEYYVYKKEVPSLEASKYSELLSMKLGAFVSLYQRDGSLRGCIGNLFSNKPLIESIKELTIASATNDPRFSPVSKNEIEQITIEISVLSPLKRIADINEIELGKHGILIRKDHHSGTFLPQVANKTNWSVEEFLGHCSRDKAGIGWDGWKKADIYIYEAHVFSEYDM